MDCHESRNGNDGFQDFTSFNGIKVIEKVTFQEYRLNALVVGQGFHQFENVVAVLIRRFGKNEVGNVISFDLIQNTHDDDDDDDDNNDDLS
jgi:hypothetical protein